MSLYLKYRPQDFENLVGQSFIKDTLSKAITLEKTVGAYLFCGPRGTGKTSTARIFAKAINCLNPKNGNPCLECNICKDFAEDRLMDIIEIDAASNTGVENIRDIIERAQFSPTNTKYKVYIIDEVHMLSKGAFNALLKILEEPPKHVKFILATTETHKVPDTIISRCQRYDFKRISDLDIKQRLELIANKENVKVDIKSLEYIIKNSGGGLRNAISLFEQLIFNSELNYEEIIKKLEIIDENILEQFLEKLINKDREVITILEKLINDGKNIKLFFKELLFYSKEKTVKSLKDNQNISKYLEILEILDETYSKTKNSLDENTTFLIGVLKILEEKERPNTSNQEEPHPNPLLQEREQEEKVKKEEKNINIKIIDKKIKNEVKEQEINSDDIVDIFGDTNSGEYKKEEINNSNFNKQNFIEKLQDLSVKSANINTIKNSNLEFENNNLTINISNSFLKKTIDKAEVLSLFSEALKSMGYKDSSIIIK